MKLEHIITPKRIEVIEEGTGVTYSYDGWDEIGDYYLFRFDVISMNASDDVFKITVKRCNEYLQPVLRLFPDEDSEDLTFYLYSVEIFREGELVLEVDEDGYSYLDDEEYDSYKEILHFFIYGGVCSNRDKAAYLDGYIDADYVDLAPNHTSETFDAETAARLFLDDLKKALGDLIDIKPVTIIDDLEE